MPTSERGIDRAARRASRFLVELGEELRRARAEAGLSQAAVGARLGLSQSLIARVEAGRHRVLSIHTAARLLSCVGRDLSMRVYRGAGPIHDIGQLQMLEELRSRLQGGLRFRTEVPLGLAGDQRAWDAVTDGPGLVVAWECYTRMENVQATERTLNAKQRDSGVPCVVLVLKESRHNREVARAASGLRRSFPLGARGIFGAVRRGQQPRSNGFMFLRRVVDERGRVAVAWVIRDRDEPEDPGCRGAPRLARKVEEDGDLAAIRVGDAEGTGPLPSVAGGWCDQGESTLAELLCPGIHLTRSIDPEADLDVFARRPIPAPEAELEAAELQVHAAIVRGPQLEPERLLVELSAS